MVVEIIYRKTIFYCFLPTSHPSEDARMARRQQNRAAQDSAVGRKILDRASKSVTSCNVDSPETKWCDSFSQSKGGKLYLAWRTFVLGSAVVFCTLCFCFPTKMLHLNAPFSPLKCSVSPKKVTKMLG